MVRSDVEAHKGTISVPRRDELCTVRIHAYPGDFLARLRRPRWEGLGVLWSEVTGRPGTRQSGRWLREEYGARPNHQHPVARWETLEARESHIASPIEMVVSVDATRDARARNAVIGIVEETGSDPVLGAEVSTDWTSR